MDKEDKKIQWHSGFIAAMELELKESREALVFDREHTLNTAALKIDLLIIKKVQDLKVKNEIGEIFQTYNIWEYKSKEDSLNIDTFYKVMGYACLYKSYGDQADERKAEEITVSFIRMGRPRKLFNYLKGKGFQIRQPHKGIYRLTDGQLFQTQFIVIRELGGEHHVWLKALSDQLNKEEMTRLLNNVSNQTKKHDKEMADSLLDISLQANQELASMMKGDEGMSGALLELMGPIMEEKIKEQVEIRVKEQVKAKLEEQVKELKPKLEAEIKPKLEAEIKPKLEKQEKKKGRQEGKVIAYFDMNLSTGEIAAKVQLSEDEVKKILKENEDEEKDDEV